MRELSDDLSPEEKKVLSDVAEQGVHIVHVPATEESAAFSATIGLYFQFEHPELIVFGLPEEVAEDLLNAVTDAADDGSRFEHGKNYKDLLVGYPVRFLNIPADRVADYMNTAKWAYGDKEFPVMQLVWPDKQHRWPWQEGVREVFRGAQPIIGSRDA